jgi:hypothetical protein
MKHSQWSLFWILTLTVSQNALAFQKSAKKAAADRVTLTEPQVVEEGDSIFGLRANKGSDFGGATAIGGSYEYMIRPNFGFNTQLDYATYEVNYSVGPITGKWTYKAWALALMGTYHFDLFKVKNLDTFISGGLAHTFLSVSGSNNQGFSMNTGAQTSSTFLVAYANFRYFVDSNWGFTASVGTGLGTASFGVDLLF